MNDLARLPVSTLCDVDKALPVVDPAIRPLTPAVRIAGPAYTVVAAGEFLSVLWAIAEASPGDVLVVQAGGAPLAALGELLANEAARRELGGIVVDGYVRDRTGLPPELPLWARGTVPGAGRSDVAPRVGGPVMVGGVRVTPGELVLADADGIVIAPRERLEALVPRAREIEAVEAEVLSALRRGESLIEMTNLRDHVAALRAGQPSALAITPPA
jgi:4-hydroxy-4-methyl-2-oxoglutarate aldolase